MADYTLTEATAKINELETNLLKLVKQFRQVTKGIFDAEANIKAAILRDKFVNRDKEKFFPTQEEIQTLPEGIIIAEKQPFVEDVPVI